MTLKIEAKDAVSALNELSEMGFTHDFRIQGGKLVDVSTGLPVDPAAVAVVAKLRFETDAGSGDASNIYALDVDNGTARGFLVDALDFEGEGAPGDLIDKLRAGAIASVVEGSMPTICATACARFAKPSSMPIRPVMSCGWGTPISRPVHLAKGLPCLGMTRPMRNMSGWPPKC